MGKGVFALEGLTTGITNVMGVVGTMVTEITGNPIFLFFLAASMIPIALKVFKKLKGAAK